MSRILITGGFGYVGGRLSRRLSEEHEVWVSSRKPVPDDILRLHGQVKRIDHALLLDPATFPASVDVVIHLAALNEIDSVKFPSEAIRVNIDETRMILENSISKKVDQFIYFSTAHIYGAPLEGTITEESLPRPVHPYAITHRAAEDYIVAAVKHNRIKGTVLRLSNSFGAPVSPHVNRWTLLANDLCRQAVCLSRSARSGRPRVSASSTRPGSVKVISKARVGQQRPSVPETAAVEQSSQAQLQPPRVRAALALCFCCSRPCNIWRPRFRKKSCMRQTQGRQAKGNVLRTSRHDRTTVWECAHEGWLARRAVPREGQTRRRTRRRAFSQRWDGTDGTRG